MTDDAMLDASIGKIQDNVFKGRAVLVLGPGCQRVAFDSVQSPGWAEVVRRMRILRSTLDPDEPDQHEFLEHFWRSKLSDETAQALIEPGPETPLGLAEELSLDAGNAENPVPSAVDLARIEWLAKPIFRLFAAGTSRLGEVVSRGVTPVQNWHEVSDAALRDQTDADVESDTTLDSLRAHVKSLSFGATSLLSWLGTPQVAELDHPARKLVIKRGDIRALVGFLKSVPIEALPVCVEGFDSHCLGTKGATDGRARLTGANLEWLGDLLWHVITSDAEVPPSQRELAFFVNLPRRPAHLTTAQAFSRARPGEYRFARGDDAPEVRDGKIRAMLRGRGGRDFPKPDYAAQDLHEFYATLAAILVEQSRIESPRRPLAVVAGQDLRLEHYVYKMLATPSDYADGQRMHVVMPVRLVDATTGGRARIDWVVVTIARTTTVANDALVATKREIAWLEDAEVSDNEPVILRVGGAPFFPLKASTATDEGIARSVLGLSKKQGETEFVDYEVAPAVILDEYEASVALQELRQQSQGPNASASWLTAVVSWDKRAWLFLGEGFPEWVPRLRLLQTSLFDPAKSQNYRPRNARNALMAVDREFSWPESALLGTLGIATFQGDLRRLKRLATHPNNDRDVQEFFSAVDERVDPLRLSEGPSS